MATLVRAPPHNNCLYTVFIVTPTPPNFANGWNRMLRWHITAVPRPAELIPGQFSQYLSFQQWPHGVFGDIPEAGQCRRFRFFIPFKWYRQQSLRVSVLPSAVWQHCIWCLLLISALSVSDLVTTADFLLNHTWPCLCTKLTSLFLLLWKWVEPPAQRFPPFACFCECKKRGKIDHVINDFHQY